MDNSRRRIWILLATIALPGSFASAQPLNERTLIVYNTAFADSLEVAQYYATQRGVPPANLCAMTSADSRIVFSYPPVARDPIRACLNAVGPSKILYIVMTYLTPFAILPGAYALDSYLADVWDRYSVQDFPVVPSGVHGYYADTQAAGNSFPAFVSLAAYRTNPKSTLIYSVWRLDAATKALAKALVDRAIAAEALPARTGNGCFDMQLGDTTLLNDHGLASGDWDIYRASLYAGQAGFATVNDQLPTEFGTAPSPLLCPNALLYTGWYSLNNYNNAFTWNPGAIGFHLDSASALDPRAGPNWSANAIQNGITVTAGATEEPYLQGLSRAAGVFRNLFEGANVADAFLRNTRWLRWRILFLGDPLYRPFPGGLAPFNAPLLENSLRLNMRDLVGGKPVLATVQLANTAPAGGTLVSLASSNPPVATAPPSVTVPAGSRSASFNIATAAVTSRLEVRITANAGPVSMRNDFALYPLLAGISLAQPSVTGGASLGAKVLLNDRAPLGGAIVSLSSNNPAVASVPASVTVPAGLTAASFVITTSPVAANTPVDVNASYAGASSLATVVVTP